MVKCDSITSSYLALYGHVHELYIVAMLILCTVCIQSLNEFLVIFSLSCQHTDDFYLLVMFGLVVLQACENRVNEDETGHKHCTGQYFVSINV